MRCSKCILPETIPGIHFDENGVCNFCNSYKPYEPLGKEKLMPIIKKALAAKNGKYDCIVPLSGGRDSSYVLWLAKNELGLNPLAVNYNNEFSVDQAMLNMQNATKALGVDFETSVSKNRLAKKIVQSSIKSHLSSGLSWTAGDSCRACMYGYKSLVFKKAIKYSIPLIFWGETSLEATQDMEAYANKDFKISSYKKYLNLNFYKSEIYSLFHRIEYHSPGNSIFSRKGKPTLKNPCIIQIKMYDYMPWDRNRLKHTIENELGWQAPKGSSSTWRTDCALHSLINYCYVKLLGSTKDSFGLSKMICAGQITRELALEREKACISMLDTHIDELLQHLGLNESEIIKAKKVVAKFK